MGPLFAIVAIAAIFMGVVGVRASLNPFSMVVAIVAISVFGGVFREIVKSRKNLNNAAQSDIEDIKQRLAQIEADIGDIKEQIADFIIKQV